MVASFDVARFELLYDYAQAQWVLYESYLEEKVLLDKDGDWDITLDPQGHAFLTSGSGKTLWCSDLLSRVVAQHPDQLGQVFVCMGDGSGLRIEQYQQRHHNLEVPLKLLSQAAPRLVAVCLLQQSVGGAWVLWSLPSLFGVFVGSAESSSCSRWYQNWWQWWTKSLVSLGIDASLHLRKPAMIGEQPHAGGDPTRMLNFASFSSYALVASMTRWGNASKSAKEKSKQQLEAWRTCLEGIFETFISCHQEVELGIFLDTAVQMRPGLPMHGSNYIRLSVVRGAVDICPILSCDEAPVLSSIACLGPFEKPHAVPMLALCQALDRAGRRVYWLWNQIIFSIACLLDEGVLQGYEDGKKKDKAEVEADEQVVVAPEEQLAGPHGRLRKGRQHRFRLLMQVKPLLSNNRAMKLLQYYMATRRHFIKEGTVHLAVDASRIGKRQRLLGFLTRPDGVGAWLPPQAMRDLVAAATMAFAGGSETEQAEVKHNWKQLAINFFKGDEELEKNKPKKLYRTKVYEWLCATTHMLQISTGLGWGRFIVDDPLGMQNPEPLPSITISLDQGGDGWSACYYLQSLNTNMSVLCDQSHRTWNDGQLGISDADMFYTCLATIVILNADGGPWEEARWWAEMKEGVAEYERLTGPQCPIYQAYAPQIQREKQMTVVSADGRSEMDDFAALQECTAKEQQKVGMTRWFQYVVSAGVFLELWSSRLVITLHVCLQLGLFKHGKAADLMQFRMPHRDEQADIEKSTTSNDREAVRKARAGCKNTLMFMCMMLADRSLWQANVLLVEVCSPLQKWHSEQNSKNRSAKESLEWWAARAIDKGLPQVNMVLEKVKSVSLLERLGFRLSGCVTNWLKFHANDPIVEAEGDTADRLGLLCISVAARRMRSLTFFDGFPGMFAGITDERSADVVLSAMRSYDEDMQMIEGRSGKFGERLQARSPLRQRKVRQMFALARASGFTRSDDLVRVATRDFGGITQTKLIEDGVRAGWVAETNKGFNKFLSGEKCWEELIDSGVEHVKHRFTQLSCQDDPVPRGVKDRRTTALFEVSPKTVPKAYRKVVSMKSAAPYFSTSPLLTNTHVEDKALIRHCIGADCLGEAENSWLCVLAFHGRLLLSHPEIHGGRSFLSCGGSGPGCLMGIPVTTKMHQGKVFYLLASVDEFVWLPILNPRAWMSQPVPWRSRWGVRLQTGRWMQGCGCVLETTAPADTLLNIAATHGFWKIPRTGLVQLGRYLAADVSQQQSFAQVLLSVAEAALEHPLSDDEKLAILRHRLPKHNDAKEFLQSEEAKELLGDDEAKIVQEDKKAEERAADATNDIVSVAKCLAKKIQSRSGRSSGSRSSSGEAAAKNATKYPSKMNVTNEITVDELNLYFPSGCRFGIDRLDQNWRLSAFGQRYSRAWALHGYEGAANSLIEFAWQLAIEGGYETDCPFSEIRLH